MEGSGVEVLRAVLGNIITGFYQTKIWGSVLEGRGLGLSTGLGGGHKTQQRAGVWEEWLWVRSFHLTEEGTGRDADQSQANIPGGRTGLSPGVGRGQKEGCGHKVGVRTFWLGDGFVEALPSPD